MKGSNVIKTVIRNAITEEVIFEHRLLCSRHLEQSAPLNANVNMDRNNKGLVRTCHVLGAMLNLYRMKNYRCYRKDSMTGGLCAHEHMGSGTVLPR